MTNLITEPRARAGEKSEHEGEEKNKEEQWGVKVDRQSLGEM